MTIKELQSRPKDSPEARILDAVLSEILWQFNFQQELQNIGAINRLGQTYQLDTDKLWFTFCKAMEKE